MLSMWKEVKERRKKNNQKRGRKGVKKKVNERLGFKCSRGGKK